jgi:hypothetical protein
MKANPTVITRGVFTALVLVSLTCCPRERVENLGIFGESRKESILGQDGCTPVPLDGIMMWTFGDTILGSWKGTLSVSSTFEEAASMKGMISNALAFTPIPDSATIRELPFAFYREGGTVKPFIKNRAGEDHRLWRFWAIDGILVDGIVYVYYIIVYVDPNIKDKGESLLPVRIMGVGIAEWNVPKDWRPGDPVDFKRTATVFHEGEPVFGDSVILRDNYLYLLGHGPASKDRVPAFIARVAPNDLKNRAGYQFLGKGGAWHAELDRAMPLCQDVMGEPSLSYNEFLGRYILLYCSLDGAIKLASFTDFSELDGASAEVIYNPPPLPRIESRDHLFYYSGKEIFHTSKSTYAIYINPAIYQPILLRIPNSLITGSVLDRFLEWMPCHARE